MATRLKHVGLASAIVIAAASLISAQRGATKPLEIWVVDVEGGKAALYVSRARQRNRTLAGLLASGFSVPDGTFTVSNPRNGFGKTFGKAR